MNRRAALLLASPLLALAASTAACSSSSSAGNTAPTVAEDERGSVGVPPPPAEYCQKLGYTITDSNCVFPDGTSCDEWAFYRGQCGQAHSYCELHGGRISTDVEDAGTYTAIVAICTVGGAQCEETHFFQTGSCP